MTVEVSDLHKSYGRVRAARGISFNVSAGAFFAFLGVNGAGKSTTIKCLTTLLKPDSGRLVVAGHEVTRQDEAVRQNIGVVFQSPLLDLRLTVRENLDLRAALHRLSRPDWARRLDELSALLDLDGFMDRAYGRLSGGQQRRADMARALLHRPKVLFLDEPTASLDPYSREQVWEAIDQVRQGQETTIFLTTHYMAETERADQVCIIDQGQIVAQGTPAELRRRHSSSRLSVRLWRRGVARQRLASVGRQLPTSFKPAEPLWLPVDSFREARRLLDLLDEEVVDFELQHGSMDDVFLNLTGHSDGPIGSGTESLLARRRGWKPAPAVVEAH
ncbi:MAG: ABC transporter ATP-binding protein [Propionibacteriaceae bacterium]|jgi:multidrug/hemolysin transport system ATP-binding protein|nr:ABC transporter ATP-binding protein [Propionibacteriaceae bacterium]